MKPFISLCRLLRLAIRAFEARLGVRLFNRTTRSVALTEAGEQLLLRVGPAIADLQDAVSAVASTRDGPSGVIRISASESAAKPLVRNVLPSFLARYPDIHVEIVVDTRLVAVASPGYLRQHPAPQAPHDLAQHRCIRFRFESGALYRWDLERRGKSASIDVDDPMTLGNLNLMIEAALNGIGIA